MKLVSLLGAMLAGLILVACEDRDELEGAQKRIDELELQEKKLSGDLEEAMRQLVEVQEASRVADEGVRKEEKELMKEVRERLDDLEVMNAEVVRMKEAERFYAQLEKDKEDFKEGLNKALKNCPELNALVGGRRVDHHELLKLVSVQGDEVTLLEAQLKRWDARLKSKLEE